jgi:hypothetical protein
VTIVTLLSALSISFSRSSPLSRVAGFFGFSLPGGFSPAGWTLTSPPAVMVTAFFSRPRRR